MREHTSGNDSPSWKGGRTKDADGYIKIYMPGHPRANKQGRVYEHIFVMGEKLGKPVPRDFHVHHLNGVRSDNRPENLELVLPKDHERNTVQKILRRHIVALELEIKRLRSELAPRNGART
jgi:hypothetical protein